MKMLLMSQDNNTNNETLILRPQFVYWFSKYFLVILICMGVGGAALLAEEFLAYILFALFCVIFLMLSYTFFDVLYYTKWIVTDTEILIKRGVFTSRTDHLELYRVIDYAETQNFIQMIFRNKNVEITSGDKTHPLLLIFGIESSFSLIAILRTRVEEQKKKKGIYEFTNIS